MAPTWEDDRHRNGRNPIYHTYDNDGDDGGDGDGDGDGDRDGDGDGDDGDDDGGGKKADVNTVMTINRYQEYKDKERTQGGALTDPQVHRKHISIYRKGLNTCRLAKCPSSYC